MLHEAARAEGGDAAPTVTTIAAALGELSLPPDEYFRFLDDSGFLRVHDGGVVELRGRGRTASKGSHDATLFSALTSYFADRLASGELPRRPGAPEEAPNVLLDARYERGRELGLGTLGSVFEGRSVATRRRVALKEVRHVFHYVAYLSRAELSQRLERVVCAQADIEHPHLVATLDAGLSLPFPVIVTELCTGGSLRVPLTRALSRRERGLPADLVLRTMWEVALGLRALHRATVVHGGLRPENVLYDARGNVKLSDAGMMRVTERARRLSGAPVYVGSVPPAYAAPEVLQGAPSTVRSDLYGLGLLLYEMVVGDLPARRSPLPCELRPSLPPVVDELFELLTRVDEAERPASVDDVLAALRDVVPGGAPPEGTVRLRETRAAEEDPAAGFDDDDPDATQPDLKARSPAGGVD